MRFRSRHNQKLARNRAGSTSVLMALLLPVVLAISSFAINVAYMELSRTEFQIVMDVSSRAAGRVYAVSGSESEAIEAARLIMDLNPLSKGKMTTCGVDFSFGVSTRNDETERYCFVANGENPNAVQINANGTVQVPMLFPTMGVPIDFRPIKTSTSTRAEVDLALVVDRSGSMAFSESEIAGNYKPAAAPDFWCFGQPIPPNARWLAELSAIQSFLTVVNESPQTELVSLVTYSGLATRDVELTSDYGQISAALSNYSAQFWGGPTSIGDSILVATSTLANKQTARPWASRVIVVMTDGMNSSGIDPVIAAQYAASEKIIVYTVTFSAEADTVQMGDVALAGSGRHYHATTSNELTEAFKDIASRLPNLITD